MLLIIFFRLLIIFTTIGFVFRATIYEEFLPQQNRGGQATNARPPLLVYIKCSLNVHYPLTSLSIKAAGSARRHVVCRQFRCGKVGKAVEREYNTPVGLHKAGDANRAALFHAKEGRVRVAKAQKFLEVARTLADVYEREARIGLREFFYLGAVGTTRHNVDKHRDK